MEADRDDFWGKYAGADVWLWTYKDKDYVKIELEDLYQQFKARIVHELIGELLAENKELFRQARNPTSP